MSETHLQPCPSSASPPPRHHRTRASTSPSSSLSSASRPDWWGQEEKHVRVRTQARELDQQGRGLLDRLVLGAKHSMLLLKSLALVLKVLEVH